MKRQHRASPASWSEADQHAVLARYGYFGSPVDPELEDLLDLAAALAQVPAVAVHLVDADAFHCIAATGINRNSIAREASAARVALQTDLLTIPDLRQDPRLQDCAEAGLGFRFYAAAVLRGPMGERLGTLALLDHQPRQLGERLAGQLRTLARQVGTHLELRRQHHRETLQPPLAITPDAGLTHVLLDSISEGLCTMDHGGTITFCNDAFVRLLGFPTKAAVLGKHLNDVIAPTRLAQACHCGTLCPIERAAASGERARAACEVFQRPDGSILPVEYRIAPIRENGQLQGAICTFIDISERAREEARRTFMLELSDRLQRSVDDVDLTPIMSNQFACLADLGRVAHGCLEPDTEELVILEEWHSEDYTPGLGIHRLGGWSRDLAARLSDSAPVALRNNPLDDPGGLAASLDCAGLLIYSLLSPEQSLLLFGCKEPRQWPAGDLALIREVVDRLRVASERTRGIRALREAEQRVSLANEIASIGVWEYDPEQDRLHWDAQIKAMARLASDEPVPPVAELLQRIHPQDRDTVVRSFQLALADRHNGEISLDYRIRDPETGEYRWLTNRGRSITDHRGRKRILGTTREITAERNAADELRRINALLEEQIEERRQAERRQAAYIELGDLLRGQLDSDSIDAEAVRVLGSALGVDRVVLVALDGDMAVPRHAWPEPVPEGNLRFAIEAYGELAQALKLGEVIAIEDIQQDPRIANHAEYLARRGWQSLACIPRLEQGRLTALLTLLQRQPRHWPEEDLSFIRDVADRAWTADERIRAEQALRASEEQFRTLADNMSQLAWMAHPDGGIYWYNKRWYDYTGTAPETMREQGITSVQHPRHRRRVFASLRKAFGNGAVWEDTHPLRGRDGGYRWFLSQALPIRDDQGRVVHWFGTHTDITAQVAAEDALRELNDSLERRVAERTVELAQANQRLQVEMVERERAEEALRHAQKMEAIGQLTGGLAHDFNNMLTGVLGALDLLQRRLEPRGPDVERYIDAAVTSANRAASLTHRLLAFARRQSLDPQPVDVNHLVVSMEDMLRRTMGEQIQLQTDLAPGGWMAYTDAHQLENALLNLVINARDAMPGGGELTIGTRPISVHEPLGEGVEPGDYVELWVRDTGCGMPPEVIDKAFDPFFTTKPIGQGTGLGLSMVYGFVRQTGGQVRIDSRPGQGTTVTLLLPRNGEAHPSHAAQEPIDAIPRAQEGETVLVVEDEAAVRMLVVEVLRELGYTALEAVDGDSALPVLTGGRRIDLLVTDVGLPGMNGRQLAEIARHARPELKVLFITGYAPNAEVRGEFLDSGMQMLAKPFNIDMLAVRIREMIESCEKKRTDSPEAGRSEKKPEFGP